MGVQVAGRRRLGAKRKYYIGARSYARRAAIWHSGRAARRVSAKHSDERVARRTHRRAARRISRIR